MKKIAVVTGAAAGIGQSIVLELAKNGYIVYANARNEGKLRETLALGREYGVKPLIFDVREAETVKKRLSEIERIDCLVNNAGVSIKNKAVGDIGEEDCVGLSNICYTVNQKIK